MRATFSLAIYPDDWKNSKTIVLRKPGRPDYSIPKAYRPIALLNCIGKILSACVADILVFESERLNLLPNHHFGGRPGRSTSDAVLLLIQTIQNAWRRGEVVSALFLDVKATFPSARLEQLWLNMRQRGVPMSLITWLQRRMLRRRTRLLFDDYVSDTFDIPDGIDQGCPPSVVLYNYYNAPLIDSARSSSGETAIGFVDDGTLITTAKSFADTHSALTHWLERADGAFAWSDSHDSKFELDKFALLNMSARAEDRGPSLVLPRVTIPAKSSHTLLGVMIDYRLRFAEQRARALAKGMTWTQQLQRFARVKNGVTPQYMRRLYNSVAIPRFLYCAEVFLTPPESPDGLTTGRASTGAIRRLARVHRQAALLITGAMRSTPTLLLDAHADLLPFPLLVNKICHRAAVRLCTLPQSHPLHQHVEWCSRRYVQHHRSPLHELLWRFQVFPDQIETRNAIRFPPDWRPVFTTSVAPTKKSALREEATWAAHPGWRVYSDGSCIDNGVGAAAVLLRPNKPPRTLRLHLGSADCHTVYEAEIVGLILGLHLLQSLFHVSSASCAADNRAAVLALTTNLRGPDHYLLDYLHEAADRVRRKHHLNRNDLVMRWVPGHRDVEGNELADRAAKEAARGASSPSADRPPVLRKALPTSASVLKQTYAARLTETMRRDWQNSERGHLFNYVDPDMPTSRFTRTTRPLQRRQASLLVQLRTGHIPLQHHLYRIQRADTRSCPHCAHRPETPHHVIMCCPEYRRPRAALFRDLGSVANSLARLLSSPRAFPALFRFLRATGRFESTFDLRSPPDKTPATGST